MQSKPVNYAMAGHDIVFRVEGWRESLCCVGVYALLALGLGGCQRWGWLTLSAPNRIRFRNLARARHAQSSHHAPAQIGQ